MRTLTSLGLALTLFLTGFGAVSATAALPPPAATATATAAPSVVDGAPNTVPARAKKWKCGKWKDGGSHAFRWCVRFTKIKPILKKKNYTYAFNKFKKRHKVTCAVTRSTTWTFHASGTVEAEAGVIFAKAKASVTAGGSRETSTSTTMSATFPVKGKGVGYCAWGHAGFKLSGETRKEGCNASKCGVVQRKSFSGVEMPSSPFFEFGPGRDIDWRSFLPQV